MASSVLPPVLVCVVVGALIALLVRDHRQARYLKLCAKKLYASRLFEDMLPMLSTARKRHVEQISIDKTGVAIRYLQPAYNEEAFLMRPHGYPYLTPLKQEALRLVLEDCLPKLRDRKRYCLGCRRIRLINGEIEYAYRYTMLNAYKARLARAPYYDGTLRATHSR